MLHSDAACLQVLDTITDADINEPFTRDVFLLAQSLFIRGVKPTPVELYKEGMALGFIQTQDDREKIKYISDHHIEAENAGYWISKVKAASKGRALQRLINKYSNSLNEQADIPELIRQVSGEIFALALDVEVNRTMTGKDLAEYGKKIVTERVESYRKLKEQEKFPGELILLEGVPTGLPSLDRLSFGYKPGDLILLGAETGHGKTAFALHTSKKVCIDAKRPLLYLNTEMSKKQIAYRWAAMLSDELAHQIRQGSLTNEQLNRVMNGFDLLLESGFYFDTETSPTPYKIDVLTRKAKLQWGIEIMVLDYVGRMEKTERGKDEWQVLEQIVKSQKQLAQDQEIAVLVLAQLNEGGSLQGAKRMRNECDIMLKLLPAKGEYAQAKIEERTGKLYEPFNYVLYVDKARDFATGKYIPLIFNLEKQQIQEAKEIDKRYSTPPPGPPKPKKSQIDSWLELGREVELDGERRT